MSRNGYTEVPAKACLVTPRSKRPMKMTGSESNTSSAINQSKHLTDRSPKIECRTAKALETEVPNPVIIVIPCLEPSSLRATILKSKDHDMFIRLLCLIAALNQTISSQTFHENHVKSEIVHAYWN